MIDAEKPLSKLIFASLTFVNVVITSSPGLWLIIFLRSSSSILLIPLYDKAFAKDWTFPHSFLNKTCPKPLFLIFSISPANLVPLNFNGSKESFPALKRESSNQALAKVFLTSSGSLLVAFKSNLTFFGPSLPVVRLRTFCFIISSASIFGKPAGSSIVLITFRVSNFEKASISLA